MIIANSFPKCGTNLLKKVLVGYCLTQGDGQITKFNPFVPAGLVKSETGKLNYEDDIFYHSHIAPVIPLDGDAKMIYIIRNPRNATISFLRWAEKRGKPELKTDEASLKHLIVNGAYGYGPWPLAMLTWSAWAYHPDVLTVRFENICIDGGHIVSSIGKFIGIETDFSRDKEIYDNLYGTRGQMPEDKSTYTGKWSRWQDCDYWTDEVEDIWAQCGGLAAEKVLGYNH